MIAILTPVYNRSYIIEQLYNSLINQTDRNFVWYVINDGSTDDIDSKVEKFLKENVITIKYLKQPNGGKHRALNLGINYVLEDFVMIVDSDDYLRSDAVEIINKDISTIDSKLAGISYLRVSKNNEVIGKKFKNDYAVGNYIIDKINKGDLLDKAEIYKTSILKQYPFSEYDNEKFLFEDCVWLKIAFDYNILLRNEGIYICEYLSDGLTKKSRKHKLSSPQGMIERAILWMNKQLKFKFNVRGLILYNVYKRIIKKKKVKQLNYMKNYISNIRLIVVLLYPLCYLISIFLSNKWLKGV